VGRSCFIGAVPLPARLGNGVLGELLDSLAPEPCCACGDGDAWGPLRACPRCAAAIPLGVRSLPLPDPLTLGWALGPYEGALGALVRAGKYAPRTALLAALGQRLGRALRGRETRWDAVTWVPSPRVRRLGRGFDPAATIARAVARELARPLLRTLRRTDPRPQAARSDRDRRAAIRGAYETVTSGRKEARFLLVDDVITTGATLATCGDVLLCSGARAIDGASVAARDL
jgi:predicted amidophosphoribosyltransferase